MQDPSGSGADDPQVDMLAQAGKMAPLRYAIEAASDIRTKATLLIHSEAFAEAPELAADEFREASAALHEAIDRARSAVETYLDPGPVDEGDAREHERELADRTTALIEALEALPIEIRPDTESPS